MHHKKEKNMNTVKSSHISCAIGFMIYIFAYFLIPSRTLKIPMFELITNHINLLYEFDNNMCVLNSIGNIPIYMFSYYFVMLAICLAAMTLLLGLILKWKDHVFILRKILFISITISFSLLILLQQIGRIKFIAKEAAYVIGKTTQEKLLGRFDLIYDFPKKARLILNKEQKIAFYTDLGSNVDSLATSKSLLKYFLYPDIILIENPKDITCYTVLLYLADPEKYIQDENMKVLLNMNNEIILTRKK